MTTDRPRKQAPRIGLTGLEWKLLLTAALGASYTAAWLAIGAQPAAAPASTQPTAGPRRAKATTAVARAPRPSNRVRTRSS